MPEGDTIHKAARSLDRVLTGKQLVRFDAARVPGPRPEPGTTITGVEARGKHLLVHFAAGPSLHTHMRMTGSWHIYRTGERWRKAAGAARVVIEVDGVVAVCFSAPVVELIDDPDTHPALAELGPDLCREDADLGAAADRLARVGALDPDIEIGEALLDQRVASGVGNVFKSEVLHAVRLDPSTRVADVDAPLRLRVVETAARQLRANLGGGPRTTIPGGLAVYGRAGRPCRRCGFLIRSRPQGSSGQPRGTYWCPGCQGYPPVQTS